MDRRTLFLAALLLAPALLPAQTTRATFIDWGNVTGSVYADGTYGVQLWIGTSFRAMNERSRSVTLGFAPDSVYPWADAATLVIAPAHPPRDTASVLAAPPLRALDGTLVRILRRAAGNAWGDRVVLSFESSDTTIPPLNIAARPDEARNFVESLYQKAASSTLAPDWQTRIAELRSFPCAAGGVVTRPGVASGAVPEYPPGAPASGRVLLEFVVGANGYADRAKIVAIATSNEVFVHPSIEAVVRTRFTPGTCNGAPVPVLVRQSVNFVR